MKYEYDFFQHQTRIISMVLVGAKRFSSTRCKRFEIIKVYFKYINDLVCCKMEAFH